MEPETLGPNSLEIKELENNCTARTGSCGWGEETKVRPRRAAEEAEQIHRSNLQGDPAAPAAADGHNDPIAGQEPRGAVLLATGGAAWCGRLRAAGSVLLARGYWLGAAGSHRLQLLWHRAPRSRRGRAELQLRGCSRGRSEGEQEVEEGETSTALFRKKKVKKKKKKQKKIKTNNNNEALRRAGPLILSRGRAGRCGRAARCCRSGCARDAAHSAPCCICLQNASNCRCSSSVITRFSA